MKSDIIYSDDGQRLTYFSKSDPSISITVSRGAIYEASRVAGEWAGGVPLPLASSAMARFADGDFSFATVCQAARELAWMARTVANRVRYKGQAEQVELLTTAHRACARVMANVLMTDELPEERGPGLITDVWSGTTDRETDNVDLRDDLRDRGQE